MPSRAHHSRSSETGEDYKGHPCSWLGREPSQVIDDSALGLNPGPYHRRALLLPGPDHCITHFT